MTVRVKVANPLLSWITQAVQVVVPSIAGEELLRGFRLARKVAESAAGNRAMFWEWLSRFRPPKELKAFPLPLVVEAAALAENIIRTIERSEEPDMSSPSSEARLDRRRQMFRLIIAVLALSGITIVGATIAIYLARDIAKAEPWMMDLFRNHASAVLGLPTAALAALCVVLFLETSSGPIEFEGLGFKFRGASGEIVLWMICFLAIVGAIKLLW